MPDVLADARQLIQSRLADLEAEAEQLEGALKSLGEGSTSRRRQPGRPRKGAAAPTSAPSKPKRRPPSKRGSGKPAAATSAPPKPKRRSARKRRAAKRAPRGQRREQLLAAIKATPGARPSELAKAIGVKPTQVPP
jgi:hypothetical protein